MKRYALPWGTLRLAAVVALVMGTALVLQGTVDVKAQQVTKTSAVSSATGVAPVIECKWELPDMENGDGLQNPFPDITFEYGKNTDTATVHTHDDNARTPTPVNPCFLPPASTTTTVTPTMLSGAINMMDITANPGDLPELRRFQMWMAVDHANGIGNIGNVFWDVFHPNGTPKTQVHGIKVNVTQCGSLGSATAQGTMFEAAVHSGQISAAAVDDPVRGMVALCHEQAKAIYWGEWTVSKEQPCGDYVVKAHAVNNDGLEGKVLENSFHVVCFFSGQADFTTLDFGSFTPGITDRITGDILFGGSAPTLRNVGNIGMEPAFEFHLMCNSTVIITRKCIDQFDVSFGTAAATLQSIDPIFVATNGLNPLEELANDHTDRVDFDNAQPRVLCADQTGKVDFSMHPVAGLPAGTYTGAVDVFFQAVRGTEVEPTPFPQVDFRCPTDQEHLPPPFTFAQ